MRGLGGRGVSLLLSVGCGPVGSLRLSPGRPLKKNGEASDGGNTLSSSNRRRGGEGAVRS